MEFSKKEAGADDDICAWIYLLDILQENEKIITYKSGNKLVGFCGYSFVDIQKKIQINIWYLKNSMVL